jgi:hypothetical protein
MNIILLNNFCKRKGMIELCVPRAFSILLFGSILFASLFASAGYYVASQQLSAESSPSVSAVSDMIHADRQILLEEKAQVQAHLDAMAIRLGDMQAQLMRLDALGGRLVDVAQLDSSEFDFSLLPPMGGADSGIDPSIDAHSTDFSELDLDVNHFSLVLEDRIEKLDMIESLLSNGSLYEEITPSGRPVVKGWLSSRYGKRIDPKNGKKTFHRGHDFAGKEGSEVIAVASGLVVRSEFDKGFGNVIEIKHPDGYITLYAHNKENLVEPGDMVKKGQQIALLGSTGRSTGPHVHFEVHRDNKHINPSKFVQ